MVVFPDAFNDDMLEDILDANDSAPSLSDEERQRIIDVTETISGAMGALDSDNDWCLIGTTWQSFCENTFGTDDNVVNRFAIGVHEADISSGKGATLFSNTRIVQHKWLKGGDNRRSQYKTFIDDGYDDANEGDLWIPKSAQEYICIVELKDELIHGKPTLSEAM
jgi:hypothetical protein